MKQTFKLFVAIIMVSAFYVIEINADSTVNKELKVLKKEYTPLEKEYNKLIEQGAPSAVIQRKGEELGKLSEVIGKFENGGNTNQTHISNTDISIEDIVLTQNIDAVTDPGTDASSQNNSQPKKSNTNEEISLTVSSDGATKDDALKNALRTAIEQAYGAFVSANTTILNDELVKDEIVTVSNGSIKDYKEVSSFEKPDGSGYMITVNATVSLPHLITYAKNHGSECEFAGNTFGMELKLFNLQKENELKALYNMLPMIDNLCKTTMHWELEVEEPQLLKCEKKDRYWYIGNTGTEIPFNVGADDFLVDVQNCDNYCIIPMNIYWLPNEGRKAEDSQVYQYIENTINQLSLSNEEREIYYSRNLPIGKYYFDSDFGKFLRNSDKTLDKWGKEVAQIIQNNKQNFVILDNTGQQSDFFPIKIVDDIRNFNDSTNVLPVNYNYHFGEDYMDKYRNWIVGGTGLFSPLLVLGSTTQWYTGTQNFGFDATLFQFDQKERIQDCKLGSRRTTGGWKIFVIIPTKDIQQYSSFKVVAKDR